MVSVCNELYAVGKERHLVRWKRNLTVSVSSTTQAVCCNPADGTTVPSCCECDLC